MAGINETPGRVGEAWLLLLWEPQPPRQCWHWRLLEGLKQNSLPIHSLNRFQRLLRARSCAGFGWGWNVVRRLSCLPALLSVLRCALSAHLPEALGAALSTFAHISGRKKK